MTEADHHLSEKLRWLRLSKGLSREDAADEAGISSQMLYKYEMGQCRLSSSQLYNIAKAYSAPISFLLNDEVCSVDDLNLLNVPGALELIEFYTNIEDKTQRQAVLDIVQAAGRL